MLILLNISIIVILAIILIEDLRQRQISAILIPLLAISFSMRTILESNFSDWLLYCGRNLAFVLVQMFILVVFLVLRKKRLRKIIDVFIGWGDILLFFALCTAFSTANFLAFYTFALIASLILVIGYNLLFKKMTEIPLAGVFAGLIIPLLVYNTFDPTFLFTNDALTLKLLHVA